MEPVSARDFCIPGGIVALSFDSNPDSEQLLTIKKVELILQGRVKLQTYLPGTSYGGGPLSYKTRGLAVACEPKPQARLWPASWQGMYQWPLPETSMKDSEWALLDGGGAKVGLGRSYKISCSTIAGVGCESSQVLEEGLEKMRAMAAATLDEQRRCMLTVKMRKEEHSVDHGVARPNEKVQGLIPTRTELQLTALAPGLHVYIHERGTLILQF